MLAGVIFGAVAIAWIVILVPYILTKREPTGLIDDDAIDKFANSMKLVRRSSGSDAGSGFLTDSGARVSTPLTRSAAHAKMTLASRTAVGRRRRGLLVHLVLAIAGGVVPFFVPISHWWSALPAGLLVGWLVIARISTVTLRRMLDTQRAELRSGDEEPTVIIQAANQDETVVLASETERSIELTSQIGESLGSLWDPIPVTPTTYVSRPLLPRSVRTIDLAAPVASSELRVPVTAEQPGADDGPVQDELPRAVGE